MKKSIMILIFSLFSLGLTGCSLDASMEAIESFIPIKFADFKAAGLISGSTQRGHTTDYSYQVQSSVGNYTSRSAEQTTTDNSYKVSSSLQGAFVSK